MNKLSTKGKILSIIFAIIILLMVLSTGVSNLSTLVNYKTPGAADAILFTIPFGFWAFGGSLAYLLAHINIYRNISRCIYPQKANKVFIIIGAVLLAGSIIVNIPAYLLLIMTL